MVQDEEEDEEPVMSGLSHCKKPNDTINTDKAPFTAIKEPIPATTTLPFEEEKEERFMSRLRIRKKPNDTITTAKATSTALKEPVLVTVTSPLALERAILEVDGRSKGNAKADPWHRIRCKRELQDMGSLSEIRTQCYLRNSPSAI